MDAQGSFFVLRMAHIKITEDIVMHNIQIATERLLLRPLQIADVEAVFEWVSDERVSRYMVYTTYTDLE